MDFLASLPRLLSDLEQWQYDALVSYGIDPEFLYDLELETINKDELSRLHYKNDPVYRDYKDKVSSFVQRGVKKKKENDYKNHLESNLESMVPDFDEWHEEFIKQNQDYWLWVKSLA